MKGSRFALWIVWLFWGGEKTIVHEDGWEETVDTPAPLGWLITRRMYGWLNRHVLPRLH